MPVERFQQIMDESVERGARKVLAELGLKLDETESAAVDLRDMRSFFRAWRQAKDEALKRVFSAFWSSITFLIFFGLLTLAFKWPEVFPNGLRK